MNEDNLFVDHWDDAPIENLKTDYSEYQTIPMLTTFGKLIDGIAWQKNNGNKIPKSVCANSFIKCRDHYTGEMITINTDHPVMSRFLDKDGYLDLSNLPLYCT